MSGQKWLFLIVWILVTTCFGIPFLFETTWIWTTSALAVFLAITPTAIPKEEE